MKKSKNIRKRNNVSGGKVMWKKLNTLQLLVTMTLQKEII